MSINLMSAVWKMPIPSTPKLVLLSLADQVNDEGAGVCWPSQPQIAKRCSLSDRAVRDQLTWLEARKIIRRNVRAGIGTTFTITLCEYAEPRNDVPPRNNIPPRNDVPPTPEQYSTNPGTTFRQIISNHKEPSNTREQARSTSPKPKRSKAKTTLQAFLDTCASAGEKAIPESHPIFTYTEKVGISGEMVAACWSEFKEKHLLSPNLQADWRKTFQNVVRGNYYRLWFLKDGDAAQWTTAGEQARRAAA